MCSTKRDRLDIFIKCYLSLDGSWKEVPARFCDLLGLTKDELINQTFSDLVHAEDRELISSFFDTFKTGHSVENDFELRLVTKSGDAVSILLSGLLIRDKKGNPESIACHIQNLSTQEQILQKLEEREQQFNSLFKNNPHPVYYFDLEGNFERANEKLVEFTGYSREELLEKGFEEFIVDGDLERTKKHFKKAAAGQSGQYEISVTIKNGEKRDIKVTKFPRYSGKDVIGVFGILQDITNEKKSKRKLQRSRELAKSLFTHNPYPVIRFSLDGKFEEVNKKTVELSGLRREELMNLDFSSFIAAEDHERIAKHFEKAAKGESQHYEVKVNTETGEKELEVTLSPIYVMGEITGLFCIAKDITEEKRVKHALKKSEERWQQLVKQNPQPVQIIQHGKIVFINKAGAEYYGAEAPEELIGKSILDFTHPDYRENILERKKSLENNQTVDSNEQKILLLNGEERYIEAHSIPISYKGERAIQTVIHDITNLKEKQENIGKSLKEKEMMLKEIHHRVKNNLSVISSMIELQVMQSKDASVINTLRDSQLRIRSIAMIHEKLYQNESLYDINFDDYLKELVQTIQETYTHTEKNIKILFDLDSVQLDINQVIPCSLIINEVIVNCYKHAFHDKTNGELKITLDYQDPKIDLTISDDGKGLPGNFKIEEQESLGMTLIQAFSDQLEGTINFQNAPKRSGTLFRLQFERRSGQI